MNGGYKALNAGDSSYGKLDERIYTELTQRPPDRPLPLPGRQLLHGPRGLINSGGASGKNDFAEAVETAVINKRAGGMGLISGRKAFQRPMAEGAKLLQDDPGRVPVQGDHRRLVRKQEIASHRARPKSAAHGLATLSRGRRERRELVCGWFGEDRRF